MKEFALGIIVACLCVFFFAERKPMKPKEVAVIQKQIIHRNDTVRIIDSATAMKKLRVHKLSKKQVREEFDSAFAVDSAFVQNKNVDTMVVAVDQLKKCLELQVQHEGDSAKLMLDKRTLDAVDSTVSALNVEQKTDWKEKAKDIGLGVGIGALGALLLMWGN